MKIIITILLISISFKITAQEQFRLDFQYCKKFTATGGKNKDGSNKGYWGKLEKENNSFVFNYNAHKDIVLFTANEGKIIYKRTGKQFESELASGRKFRILNVTNPKGIKKVIQYFEDDVIRIVDPKGMIEFTTEEMNLTDEPNLLLYNTIQNFTIVNDKPELQKTLPTAVTIKQTNEIISVDLGFGEMEYVIYKNVPSEIGDDNERHYECYKKGDINHTYLISFFPGATTMFNDTLGYKFFNSRE